MAVAEANDVDVDVQLYMQDRPTKEQLTEIVGKLEDPIENLVRKDSKFKKWELNEDDYTTPEAIVALLVEKPALIQRPVLVRADKAIIGRPLDGEKAKDRIAAFLAGN